MVTAKERAQQRFRKKMNEQLNSVQVEQNAQKHDEIKAIVMSKGWGHIVDRFQKKLEDLREELLEMSSFRVFKRMQLQNQYREAKKLYSILKSAEMLVK